MDRVLGDSICVRRLHTDEDSPDLLELGRLKVDRQRKQSRGITIKMPSEDRIIKKDYYKDIIY